MRLVKQLGPAAKGTLGGRTHMPVAVVAQNSAASRSWPRGRSAGRAFAVSSQTQLIAAMRRHRLPPAAPCAPGPGAAHERFAADLAFD